MVGLGHELGLVDGAEVDRVRRKYDEVRAARAALGAWRNGGVTGEAWLRRPEVRLTDLVTMGHVLPALDADQREALEIRVKYEGYIERTRRQLDAEAASGDHSLAAVEYAEVSSLSTEAREKLSRLRPGTVAQAARIPGVRHSDVTALLVHLRASGSAHARVG